MKKIISLFFIFYSICFSSFSQSHISTQAHQAAVSVIANANNENSIEKNYFSAGKDGFLVKWTDDNQGEHYQISDLEIKLVAVSPNANEIAIYETDGGLINRVSVWNWDTLSRKFARRFSDSITSLSYSEKGTYLIVGTATVDGAVFIKAANGSVVNKLTDNTGIVSLINTSASEKTAVMYSPAGNLSYYNLLNGTLKQKFTVAQGLEQPLMFSNSMFLAGVKDELIYIIQGISGKTVATVKADNPILLTSKNDSNLYYLTNDGKGAYVLNMLENIENKTVSTPIIVKNYKGPRNTSSIICGSKNGNEIVLGSKSGAIYRTNANPETEIISLDPITENTYDKILDMAPIGEDFYFLTRNAIYKSSYDTGMVDRKGDNPGHTQLITYGNKIILWSKATREPVLLFDYSIPEITPLFTPKNNIQSIRLFGNTIIEMESNSVVNKFDMESRILEEVYTGAGLQDAIIGGDNKLYVAKSFATNPRSSMLCIDFTTKETVPLNIGGNVSFALNVYNNDIYGISVQVDAESKNTAVFKYNTVSKLKTTILRLKDEDPEAFTYLYYPILYTNIGKDNVRSCNLSLQKNFTFKRSASIPVKVCQNANRVVILNKDGSISWYNTDLSQVLADWYLTKDGQWFEF